MFSRKDRFLLQEPKKMDLHFFDFSKIFNEFSKAQLETLTHIYTGPLNFLTELRNNPYIAKTPWTKCNQRNWVPGRVWTSPAAGLAAGGGRTWLEEPTRGCYLPY
jgi:hypothetical protein